MRPTVLMLLILVSMAPAWADPAPDPSPTPMALTQQTLADPRVHVHGSVVFRSEEDMSGSHDLIVSRFRYKAYNSLTYDASDQFQYGLRLRSGNPFTPNSASETINTHQVEAFQMDQAYVDFHPRHLQGWDFELGSFADPYRFSPIYNQMEWSPDNLNVGGFATQYKADRWWGMASYGFDMPSDTGGFGGVTDTQLQAGYILHEGHGHRLEASAGMQWIGFTRAGELALLARNRGNAVETISVLTVSGSGKKQKTVKSSLPVGLASGFDIFNPRLDYYFMAGRKNTPMVASAEYFDNLASSLPTVNVNGKTGYGVGVMAGQVKWPGTIAVRLEYMQLGQDSVMSMFNQSDFPRALNCDGFYFSISQPVTRHLTVNWILNQVDQSASAANVDRGRVDVVYSW